MASPVAPASVFSFLDTDLYKLTMQCAILKYFPSVEVEYTFTNRTPQMRLNTEAYAWLQEQVLKLGNIRLDAQELQYLRDHCTFLTPQHLSYLQSFRLRPAEQVILTFTPVDDTFGDLSMVVQGLWVETILYEIPLLALTSEAYFRFVDRDWDYEGQEEEAYEKGLRLLTAGCVFSDFGSRRRRDFHTQDLVIAGLVRASKEHPHLPGKLTGTSNVYFAMKHGIPPIGTVAHEWYMGIAALMDDYEHANELGLRFWMGCFGPGVLAIALTDTFGTPDFFKAFKKPIRAVTSADARPSRTEPADEAEDRSGRPSYAEVFAGIRQDSGDPKDYVRMASHFYKSIGVPEKTIVFSDSLNVDKCIEYKAVAEKYGFTPSFGVGTFLTNDFTHKSDPHTKSPPLNIVIKLSKAGGRPAVKISDNIGKNTGDTATVQRVKKELGYTEHSWTGGDEAHRW